MDNLQFHEAANIFPMMSDDEANALLDDIRENGQKYAIEIYDGQVLDGRNRYVQCLKLGIECEITDVTADIDDPVKHVLTANLHRRHLTASQKAMIAGKANKLIEKMEAEAKVRQAEAIKTRDEKGRAKSTGGKVTTSGEKTRDKLGKIMGVSGSMVDRGRKVAEKGVPELSKAVEEGRMSVTTAAKLTEESQDVQKLAAEDAKFSAGRYRPLKVKTDKGSTGANKNYDKTERYAMECARCAITQLEQIPAKNPGREQAFDLVKKWILSKRKT